MAETLTYVVVGQGRWAGVMQRVLTGEGRGVSVVPDARPRNGESDVEHVARIAADLKFSGAQVAWFCLKPGPHIALVLRAALDVGLHVVVEKPWLCDGQGTDELAERARARGVVGGI